MLSKLIFDFFANYNSFQCKIKMAFYINYLTQLYLIEFQFVKMLNLSELLLDVANLTIKSCFIIKQISQKMNNVYYKDNQNDPVTEADYLVQWTISTLLSTKYPGVKIIGQQNTTPDDKLCNEILQKTKDLTSQYMDCSNMIEKYPFDKETILLEIQNLCIWIDPLDCTRGFVSDKKQQVTILVGISFNGQPIAGVIGQPFVMKAHQSQFDPHVFIGSEYFSNQAIKKFSYQYHFQGKSWTKWEQFDKTQDELISRKVAVSSRRIPLRQHMLMDKMSLERVETGGAGNKFIMIIQKKVASLMFVDAKTSKWDSCAGEAILKSMGGFTIKPSLEQICYQPKGQRSNSQGFIVCLSPVIYDELVKNISEESFQNYGKFIQKPVTQVMI